MRIDKDKSQLTEATELRHHAEERLQAKTAEQHPPRTKEETQRLVHELEVHQIELEMQNAELREARDEVESALEKYTDLYDFAPVGYFSLDRNGKISSVNLNGARLLGIERASLIGRRFGQFVLEKHLPEFTTFFDTVFTSQVKEACEVSLLNKKNLPLIVQIVQIEALTDPSGQECRLALIDITVRRQAEDALRESEGRMYKLAEMAVDAMIMVDDRGMVTFCNAAAESMFGCTAAEITGQDFHRLFVPERLRSAARQGFDRFRVQSAGPLTDRRAEVVALRNDGTEFPMELSVSALNIKGKWHAIAIMRDITERKRVATALQKSEQKFSKIFHSAPVLIGVSSLKEGTFIDVNQTALQTLGYKREEVIGKTAHEFGLWKDEPERAKVIRTMEEQGSIRNVEVILKGKTGQSLIGQLSAEIINIDDDQYMLTLVEDITERKLLEAEIQDAREYAENIVETVREPLVVLNYDLKILTANHSFYETFKVTPEDTIGKFIYDLGNRQWDIPKLRVLVEEILPLDTVINGYEVEHDFPGIGRKTILLNARQIFRENIGSHIILLAMEDITERKLAEERISEVIRQQQAILDNIPNIAWLKDREGRYVAVNEPFSKAFGVAPEDLVGKNVYDIYPPEIAEKYENNFREVMASGTRTYFEESVVDRDGKIQHLEKIETPIFNDAGVVIGIIGIAHDITSRKEVEVTLRYDCTHDILTGLYNRAFFDEELQRLAHGRMFPMSIVMADINGLKTVNDTLGHEAGDDLIRMAGRIILRAFRAEDIVARFGGDEFAVILPETASTVAEEAVERIMSCPEINNGLVSIAFGIASAESKDQIAEALKHSDERMYRDKSAQKES